MTTTVVSPGVARRTRALDRARLVAYGVAIGAVVTLGMWLRHGQLSAASGPGGFATALGQLTALAGTYAILIELLLMSRIAWLERAIGLDHLAVWHRWTGFSAVTLLTAHVVCTTIGWAASAIPSVSIAHETGWMISHEPDVLMAWVGFALLVGVAVTSMRIARQRLRRETWYFVHLYAYLAVALSFAHQLAVGSDFDKDRAARIWWIGLYVFVFGAIMSWRVVQPLLRNAHQGMRVHSVQAEAPGVVSIWVKGRDLKRLDAQPGQFFLWRFLTRDGWWKSHPFSLSAAPTSNMMRLTIKDLGDTTAQLQYVEPGTRVFAEGPYGTFTIDRRIRRKVLLLAGGIGITPLRAMLDALPVDTNAVMIYRVATPDEVVFSEELRAFADSRRIKIYVVPGIKIGNDQTDALSLSALKRAVPDVRTRDCFVCGPPGFIDALGGRLRKLHVPPQQIHYEKFEL